MGLPGPWPENGAADSWQGGEQPRQGAGAGAGVSDKGIRKSLAAAVTVGAGFPQRPAAHGHVSQRACSHITTSVTRCLLGRIVVVVFVVIAGAIFNLVQDNAIQFCIADLQSRLRFDQRGSFRFARLDNQDTAVYLGGQYGGVGERRGRGREVPGRSAQDRYYATAWTYTAT